MAARPFRCRIGLHDWHTVRNNDGVPVLECQGCGELDLPSQALTLGSFGVDGVADHLRRSVRASRPDRRKPD